METSDISACRGPWSIPYRIEDKRNILSISPPGGQCITRNNGWLARARAACSSVPIKYELIRTRPDGHVKFSVQGQGEAFMPHAIMHVIKGHSQSAAQTPGERNEALGLLALCWLLAAGVFIAVK